MSHNIASVQSGVNAGNDRLADRVHHTMPITVPSFTEDESMMPTDPFRAKVAHILRSSVVESLLGIVIIFNMVMIVVETDQTANGEDALPWIQVTNWVLLSVYVIELAIKLLTFRLLYFTDMWNVLDAIVVVLDVLLSVASFFDVAGGVSILRVFRLGKLARAFRVLRQIEELNMLLMSFAAAIKSICFGMGMVLIMTTIYSVLAVQMIHPINKEIWKDRENECERCARAFETVWQSNITIFQQIIAGDSWGMLSIPIIERAPATSLFFFLVLVSVNLAMLNLILAVIVDRAQEAKAQDLRQQVMAREEEIFEGKQKLLELCKDMDTDQSGSITMEEFMESFGSNSEFASCLLSMGVHSEDVNLIFDVLDSTGSGEVPYVEFVNQLSRFKQHVSQTILFTVTDIKKTLRDQRVRSKADRSPTKALMENLSTCKDGDSSPLMPSDVKLSCMDTNFAVMMDRKFQDLMEATNRRFDQMLRAMTQSSESAAARTDGATTVLKSSKSNSLRDAMVIGPEAALAVLKDDKVTGLNDIDELGKSVLHCAILEDQGEVAVAILDRADFASVNVRDNSNISPLHLALERGRLDVCSAILSRSDFIPPESLDTSALVQSLGQVGVRESTPTETLITKERTTERF